MNYKLPKSGNHRGYEIAEVDHFLAEAKEQFDLISGGTMTAESVRAKRFALVSNGYSISAVDAALDRIEDVFAERELRHKLLIEGKAAFEARMQTQREVIDSRIGRSRGRRFKRRSLFNRGYSPREVDALVDMVALHFEGKMPITEREVRLTVFRLKRGGYAEFQVDAFIDRVIEVLQFQRLL